MERSQRLVLIGVAALFVVVVAALFVVPYVRGGGSPVAPSAGQGETVGIGRDSRQPIVDRQPIQLGGGPRTVRLYVDFHCPHCADFEKEYGPLLDQAVRDNQIRLSIYPMSFIDDGSTAAAQAFACAAENGRADEYFAGLFANPTLRWSDRQLIELGDLVGATGSADFASCVGDDRHQGWVDSINAVADADGVQQTPTMFVADQPVDLTTLTPDTFRSTLGG